MNNKVAIIIVNWNGLKFLKDCLESVYRQTYTNFDVYFIDNGSVDDSVDFVFKNFPKVKIIKLDKNTGFAYANNIGINKAFKDDSVSYILTLNNDTKVDKNFIFNLVSCINTDNTIGSVAPKIKFFYEENLIDSVGIVVSNDGGGMNRGFKESDNGQYDKEVEVFGSCAGASLYKKESLIDVKYKDEFFDNSFFAYYEDLDLAWRLRLRGWKTIACPSAIVLHVHSATGISFSPFKSFYVNRNRYFLIIKNFPPLCLLKAIIFTPFRYLKLIDSMFFKKKGPSFKLKKNSGIITPFLIVFKGFVSLFLNLPFLFLKRRYIQKSKKVSTYEINEWFKKYKANIKDMIYK